MKKTLYIFKCEYLHEHGFEGHIDRINYWYRKMYNLHRGKSATERYNEYLKVGQSN